GVSPEPDIRFHLRQERMTQVFAVHRPVLGLALDRGCRSRPERRPRSAVDSGSRSSIRLTLVACWVLDRFGFSRTRTLISMDGPLLSSSALDALWSYPVATLNHVELRAFRVTYQVWRIFHEVYVGAR